MKGKMMKGEGSAYSDRVDQILMRRRREEGKEGGRERQKDEGKGERMKGKAKG